MKNKKVIMTFSSLMIIIFHLWINLSLKNTKLDEIVILVLLISAFFNFIFQKVDRLLLKNHI